MTKEAHFGLSENDWKIFEEKGLRPLKAAGARVWIFGSRARGDHRPFSDLDVLFSAPPTSSIASHAIREALEESRISIKVDLVAEDDLAESHRPSAFEDRIEI